MLLDLEKLMRKYSVNLKLLPMIGAYALTTPTKDGYTVLLNDLCDEERKLTSLTHELFHIFLGHLDHRKDLTEGEKEAEVEHLMQFVRTI